MVDVGGQEVTRRIADVSGRITMQPATFRLIAAGKAKKVFLCSGVVLHRRGSKRAKRVPESRCRSAPPIRDRPASRVEFYPLQKTRV